MFIFISLILPECTFTLLPLPQLQFNSSLQFVGEPGIHDTTTEHNTVDPEISKVGFMDLKTLTLKLYLTPQVIIHIILL